MVSAGLAALVAVLVVVFWRQREEVLGRGVSDLRVYLGAARILAGPRPDLLYDWNEQQRQQRDWPGLATPFVNPPVVALLFVPLLHLTPPIALAAAALAVIAALAAAMRLTAGLVDRRLWLPLALAALAHPPILQLALTVQPAPLVVLAWAGFAAAWAQGKRDAAAAWLVIGLAVKPHLVLPLAGFMLVAGAWRGVALLATGGALLAAGAWALVGTAGLARYPGLLATVAASGHPAVGAGVMPNLRGLAACLFAEGLTSRTLSLGASIGILIGLAWAARQAASRAVSALVAVTGTMLASYHMHVGELVVLFALLPVAAAAGWIRRERVLAAAVYLSALFWVLYLAPEIQRALVGGLGVAARELWCLVALPLLGVYWSGMRRLARPEEPDPIEEGVGRPR
jgi:hypothetical protein